MLTLRIIPAASALPVLYDNVVKAVTAHGYDIKVLHIPSVGLVTGARPGEPPSMYDDAAFIAAHVTTIADAGNNVLLITHSYGGVPATQSIEGLTKVEREKAGKPGGVVGLAYMTSLVPEVDMPAATRSLSPLMEIGEDGWFYYPDNKLVARISFSDMSQEEGESWAKKLVKHSAASFSNPLTYAGYKHVPVSYLVAEGDQSISPETQRSQIKMIERVSGNKVDVTATSAGHAPPLTAPDDVINWILAVAKKF
ncbi:Alpha/beta hydrolase fold-1 [Plectosphaerella plurivora]|uniref:Alpha/beta hydrolase fold-1 n=1 Tax=Plectosphaerella plurivora TaxID=936078 RepID=A0A9P8V7T9_9PEZI|nr:Alpha/beta hydrolase fold-1 [Plectosphaerella plurivora]